MVVKLALKRKNENIQIWSRYSLFKNTGCSLPASSSAALRFAFELWVFVQLLCSFRVLVWYRIYQTDGDFNFRVPELIGPFLHVQFSLPITRPNTTRFCLPYRIHRKNSPYLPQRERYRISVVHDDVIKWRHFPRYWPFARGIHRWPVNSPHKGQWRGALMFSLICFWTNE